MISRIINAARIGIFWHKIAFRNLKYKSHIKLYLNVIFTSYIEKLVSYLCSTEQYWTSPTKVRLRDVQNANDIIVSAHTRRYMISH